MADTVSGFYRGMKTSVYNAGVLGTICEMPDYSSLTSNVLHHPAPVLMQVVLNDSGGTLTPGEGFTFKATYWGLRAGAASGDGARVDGVVDHLISGTVADGEIFLAAFRGLHKVVHDGAGTVDMGDFIVGAASGEFNEWGSEANHLIVGVAAEAWAATNVAKYAHLMLPR